MSELFSYILTLSLDTLMFYRRCPLNNENLTTDLHDMTEGKAKLIRRIAERVNSTIIPTTYEIEGGGKLEKVSKEVFASFVEELLK